MVSKEEAVNKLVENGMDAELKDNIVYVHGGNHKKIAKLLKEMQYNQSFGTGPKKKAGVQNDSLDASN